MGRCTTNAAVAAPSDTETPATEPGATGLRRRREVLLWQACALLSLSLGAVPGAEAQRRSGYTPPPPPPPPPPRPAPAPSARPQGSSTGAGSPSSAGARPAGTPGLATQPRPMQSRMPGMSAAGGSTAPAGGRPAGAAGAAQPWRGAPPGAPVRAMRGYQGHTTPAGKPVLAFQGRNYQVPATGVSSLRAESLAARPTAAGAPGVPSGSAQPARLRERFAAVAAGPSPATPRPAAANAAVVRPTFQGGNLVAGHALDRAARSGITSADIGDALARGTRRTLPNGLEVISSARVTVVRTPGGAVVGVYPPGTVPAGSTPRS